MKTASNPQFTACNMDAYERPITQAFGYSKCILTYRTMITSSKRNMDV